MVRVEVNVVGERGWEVQRLLVAEQVFNEVVGTMTADIPGPAVIFVAVPLPGHKELNLVYTGQTVNKVRQTKVRASINHPFHYVPEIS